MDGPSTFSVGFRLEPPALRFGVEVVLRRASERWVATAVMGSHSQTGLGTTPRAALSAALTCLDAAAVTALLADPALLEPSCAIAALGGR